MRDALQRLAHDGLLRIYPRRAIVVPKLGLPGQMPSGSRRSSRYDLRIPTWTGCTPRPTACRKGRSATSPR